jgi:hypothetical protein
MTTRGTANLLHKAERYGPLTDSQKKILDRILRNVHKAQTLLHEMKKKVLLCDISKERIDIAYEIDIPKVG